MEQGSLRPQMLRLWPADKPPPSDAQIEKASAKFLAGKDCRALAAVRRSNAEQVVSAEDIAAAHVPTLGIVGSADPYLASFEALKRVMPDLELVVIEGANHAAAPEYPEFVAALQRFLRKMGTDPISKMGSVPNSLSQRYRTSVSGLYLRFVSREDIPQLLALIRELAEFEKLLDQVSADEATLAEALFGPNRVAESVLAELNGEIVGFAVFFHNFSTFLGRAGLHLEDLYVRPHARGKGVGGSLIRFVAKIAVARRCGRLEWSVLDWNTRALDFYRRLGAVPMSDWTVQRVTGEALGRLGSGEFPADR
jgi:GNAT superfamily N-acetyltransferase